MKPAREYQEFTRLSRKATLFISVISVGIFILLWMLATRYQWVHPTQLPPLPQVFTQGWEIILNGFAGKTFGQHLGMSMFRVFASLFLAILTAVPLGILVASNDYFKSMFDPFVEFYRPLPPLAYLPLLILWRGIGEQPKIILIYLAIFAPIFLNTRAGVQAIPRERIRAALSLGASQWQLITKVLFPSSLYHILTGVRIGFGFGWTTLVAAEMIAATSGIGFMIFAAIEFMRPDVVIFGIFVIGIIAYITDFCMRMIIKKFIHWH